MPSMLPKYLSECPHCGEKTPMGYDERFLWLSAHMDNVLHRWVWRFKKSR